MLLGTSWNIPNVLVMTSVQAGKKLQYMLSPANITGILHQALMETEHINGTLLREVLLFTKEKEIESLS